MNLDLSIFLQVLDYNQETGRFTWKIAPRPCIKAGDQAGTVNSKGYRLIKFQGKHILAHRLAWYFVHGRLPVDQLDHIDCNRDNNSIKNLRECNNAQNAQRSSVGKTNKTGHRGVYLVYKSKSYQARISYNNKRKNLGCYQSFDEAVEVYELARQLVHFQ